MNEDAKEEKSYKQLCDELEAAYEISAARHEAQKAAAKRAIADAAERWRRTHKNEKRQKKKMQKRSSDSEAEWKQEEEQEEEENRPALRIDTRDEAAAPIATQHQEEDPRYKWLDYSPQHRHKKIQEFLEQHKGAPLVWPPSPASAAAAQDPRIIEERIDELFAGLTPKRMQQLLADFK